MVSASGEGGGKDVLPQLATLAGELGFHGRVVVDEDKPGANDELFDDLEHLTEILLILPPGTAIEGALTRVYPPHRAPREPASMGHRSAAPASVTSASGRRPKAPPRSRAHKFVEQSSESARVD